jgi:V8-like Glu-specific endopeptidase
MKALYDFKKNLTYERRKRDVNNSKNKRSVTAFGVWALVIISFLSGAVNSVLGEQLNIPATRPEQIISGVVDNRVLVADTAKSPFSAIVKLIVVFPTGYANNYTNCKRTFAKT